MFTLIKKEKIFTSNFNNWTTLQVVSSAFLISFWPVLAVFTLPLRIMMTEAQIPFFFFLIWFVGLTQKTYFAFVTCFLGHLFFDLMFFFNPLFFFIWLASGLSSALIAFLKNYSKLLFLIALILMPLLYIFAFSIMGIIIFSWQDFWKYFFSFPQTTLSIIFINPIFNCFVYFAFFYNKVFQKMVLLVKK